MASGAAPGGADDIESKFKRRRVRCSCKRSQCLKLYCECFSAGVRCSEHCVCNGCCNDEEHETERRKALDSVLQRNPNAFLSKDKQMHLSDPAASAILSCTCSKTACLKNYCECFQAGKPCNATCRCTGCRNQPAGDAETPPPPPPRDEAAETRALPHIDALDATMRFMAAQPFVAALARGVLAEAHGAHVDGASSRTRAPPPSAAPARAAADELECRETLADGAADGDEEPEKAAVLHFLRRALESHGDALRRAAKNL